MMARANVPRKIEDRDVSSIAKEMMADLPLLVDTKTVAKVMGISEAYLEKSRCDGVLKGRTPPPKFTRVEGRVFYKKSSLIQWLESLEERSATCEDFSR